MAQILPNKYTLTSEGGFIKVAYQNGKRPEYYEITKSSLTKSGGGELVIASNIGNHSLHISQDLINGDDSYPQIRTATFDEMYEDIVRYFNDATSFTSIEVGVLRSGDYMVIEPNTIRSLAFETKGIAGILTSYDGEVIRMEGVPSFKMGADGVGLISNPIIFGSIDGDVIFSIVKPFNSQYINIYND